MNWRLKVRQGSQCAPQALFFYVCDDNDTRPTCFGELMGCGNVLGVNTCDDDLDIAESWNARSNIYNLFSGESCNGGLPISHTPTRVSGATVHRDIIWA